MKINTYKPFYKKCPTCGHYGIYIIIGFYEPNGFDENAPPIYSIKCCCKIPYFGA